MTKDVAVSEEMFLSLEVGYDVNTIGTTKGNGHLSNIDLDASVLYLRPSPKMVTLLGKTVEQLFEKYKGEKPFHTLTSSNERPASDYASVWSEVKKAFGSASESDGPFTVHVIDRNGLMEGDDNAIPVEKDATLDPMKKESKKSKR